MARHAGSEKGDDIDDRAAAAGPPRALACRAARNALGIDVVDAIAGFLVEIDRRFRGRHPCVVEEDVQSPERLRRLAQGMSTQEESMTSMAKAIASPASSRGAAATRSHAVLRRAATATRARLG
jgi:hypothetical protein